MSTRVLACVAAVAVAAVALAFADRQQPPPPPNPPAAGGGVPGAAAPAAAIPAGQNDKDAATDRDAILKSASDFAAAFNKGDAKAIAAMYTENGESRDAGGQAVHGRAAIEKAYADALKANAGVKLDVLVKTVRFPAKDMAVEEGLLRHSRGKELPATTAYVAIHIREGGQWKVALSSEGGVGQDRLEDLDWLLGDWAAKVKDEAIKLSFVRDAKKPIISGTFTRTAPGKEPASESIRISLDPETGQIRSWVFEDDGAHSQSLWTCDGKSWILDSRGVLANGTPTAERVVIQRVGADAITWRAIDRVVGDASLADTPPVRLTRAAPK